MRLIIGQLWTPDCTRRSVSSDSKAGCGIARETVAALASGRLGALDWFEERSLEDGVRAFADLDGGRTAAATIILRPA